MNNDIPGYAMISGGKDNGKYVDRYGTMYRRVGDKMYAVETGNLAPHNSQLVDTGQVIGELANRKTQVHPTDAEIANRTRYSSDGVDEVLDASVKAEDEDMPWDEPQADPQLVQSTEQAGTEQAGEAPSASMLASKDLPKATDATPLEKELPTPESIIAAYQPHEILAMTVALKESLDDAGTEHNIKPRKGQAEASVRYNAEALAKHTDA